MNHRPERWILSDYGGVLSLPQTESDSRKLAAKATMAAPDFFDAYWRFRVEYDRGDITSTEYWNLVRSTPTSKETVATLDNLDVTSWSQPNHAIVDRYNNLSSRWRIALLSNAPQNLARAVPNLAWLPPIAPLLFSCDLRLAKPDPKIYRDAAAVLGVEPGRIYFVDDRQDNIDAAADAGFMTVHFEDVSSLDILFQE